MKKSNPIGKKVHVVFDRPLGTKHPNNGTVYEVNYGEIPDIVGGDGEGQDVYLLDYDKPLKECDCIIVAIIHRINDVEDKWIATLDGHEVSVDSIKKQTNFMEKHFKSNVLTEELLIENMVDPSKEQLLDDHIKKVILPMYDSPKIDSGHKRDHIEKVMNAAMALAKEHNLSYEDELIIKAAAACHDLGLLDGDRKNHHINSGKYVRKDKFLNTIFTPEEIELIVQAVEDHRASLDHEPRTIHGKILSTADRDLSIENMLDRMITFRLGLGYDINDYDRIYKDSRLHYLDKYSRHGYMKLPIEGKEVKKALAKIHQLENEKIFKKYFDIEYNKIKNNTLNESVALANKKIDSPEELMNWMKKNISYSLEVQDYKEVKPDERPTQTAQQLIKSKNGHCAEQSYLEKYILDQLGYDTKLVFVKENNSKKDYGYSGSAHMFVMYEDNGEYVWFEHSMEHMMGIHRYKSIDALFNDLVKNWWRCTYEDEEDSVLADTLEIRLIDKPITGVSNVELAKRCYKYPVIKTFNISKNRLEESYDPPYNAKQIKDNYGVELYNKLIKDPIHKWRMETGIELIHKEPTLKELNRIWNNWQQMSDEQKKISDKKSVEWFGVDNETNYKKLVKTYGKESLNEKLDMILNESIDYKPLSDIDKFKEDANKVLGGYDSGSLSTHRDIIKNGKLIGYIGFSEFTGGPDDDYNKALGFGDFMILERNKGYGTEVIRDIIKKNKNKYDLIYCFVDADNTDGIRFYKRLGKVSNTPNKKNQYYVELYKR